MWAASASASEGRFQALADECIRYAQGLLDQLTDLNERATTATHDAYEAGFGHGAAIGKSAAYKMVCDEAGQPPCCLTFTACKAACDARVSIEKIDAYQFRECIAACVSDVEECFGVARQ